MKKIYIIILLLLVGSICGAQETGYRHLVRVGWGDALFEKLVFHPAAGTSAYSYSGHFFADYHYSLTPVVSVGVQADYQRIYWNENGVRSRNYDLCIMPTVRFTWMRKEWVRLYSGLGLGMLVAWDNAGDKDNSMALNLNSIGIQVGKGHWCGSLDLGFLMAAQNPNRVFMFGSRLLSVSLNYRW